jgi:hypothetical protein
MKFYATLIAIGALLGAFGFGAQWLYNAGRNAERLAQAQAVAAGLAREAALAQELEAERVKKREVVRETIAHIQNIPDPSGCAAAVVPAERAQRMRQHWRDSAAP